MKVTLLQHRFLPSQSSTESFFSYKLLCSTLIKTCSVIISQSKIRAIDLVVMEDSVLHYSIYQTLFTHKKILAHTIESDQPLQDILTRKIILLQVFHPVSNPVLTLIDQLLWLKCMLSLIFSSPDEQNLLAYLYLRGISGQRM